MSYRCATCGRTHDSLPDLASDAPFCWLDRFRDEPNCLLTPDICIIAGNEFYVRGVIEIPLLDDDERMFGWGVWVSHKKENFELYRANYDSDAIGPFFGWLATELTFFPESTIALKTLANYRGRGLRPTIDVEPTDHPLAQQQQHGITLDEAWRIVHHYMPEV